jgi:hypothetical protein
VDQKTKIKSKMKTLSNLLLLTFLVAQASAQSITESDWQVAFNSKVLHGKLEVPLSTGRADIVTNQYAVEVDKASKYLEGIAQAKKYAKGSGKAPGLALYIDGESRALVYISTAKKLCQEQSVKFWLINEFVSTNDLIRQKGFRLSNSYSLSPKPESSTKAPKTTSPALMHWMSKSSGVRHNQSCRWFKRSNGHLVTARTGRACKQCGG